MLALDASESMPVRGVSGGNSRTSSGGSSSEASAAEGRMGTGAGAGRLLPGARGVRGVSLSLSPRGVAAGAALRCPGPALDKRPAGRA